MNTGVLLGVWWLMSTQGAPSGGMSRAGAQPLGRGSCAGSRRGAAGEAARGSLSPRWAGSQDHRLHLLLQNSPPVQHPSPAKVIGNPCAEPTLCSARHSIESRSSCGENLL